MTSLNKPNEMSQNPTAFKCWILCLLPEMFMIHIYKSSAEQTSFFPTEIKFMHLLWCFGKTCLEAKLKMSSLCFNYVPVCCVATVCHQFRCMYWGHLGHFHRAISHLKWYETGCMRYLACTFSQMKSINMFSMFFAIWSSQTFPLAIYCGLNI